MTHRCPLIIWNVCEARLWDAKKVRASAATFFQWLGGSPLTASNRIRFLLHGLDNNLLNDWVTDLHDGVFRVNFLYIGMIAALKCQWHLAALEEDGW